MSYITPSKALFHLDRLDQWRHGIKAAPVTIEWDLSNRCYLGCQSCHFAHTHSRGPWAAKDRVLPMAWSGTGDLAVTDTVLRALYDMSHMGVKGIIWSGGGEPTLHPEWQKIVRAAHSHGLKQGMYTAGGLLDDMDAELLAVYLQWVVFSLDAVDPTTYSREKGVPAALFEKACEGIRMTARHAKGRHTGDGYHRRAVVGVSFLLHADNWHKAEDMLALGRALGASYVTFRPTIETQPDAPARIVGDRSWITGALPMLDRLAGEADVECDAARFAEYRDWTGRRYATCHGIKLNATVTPDGRVWLCPQHRGMTGSCVGDLTTDSFPAMWQRHPGEWTDFTKCRAMCRLHLVNEALAPVFQSYQHPEFV